MAAASKFGKARFQQQCPGYRLPCNELEPSRGRMAYKLLVAAKGGGVEEDCVGNVR